MGFALPKKSSQAKPKPKTKPTPAEQAALSAQTWLPLRDLHDGLLIRQDGAVVAGIGIAPYNLALKSIREQTQAVAGLTEALNGLKGDWQWLSLYRPVDLGAYLGTIDSTLTATPQGPRRQVLADYLRWATELVRAGETVERKYYLLLTQNGKEAASALPTTLARIANALHAIRGLQATPLDDAGWRELLFLAFHAHEAAVESVPDGLPAPIPTYTRKEME